MFAISHLKHNASGIIRCNGCGQEFEVSSDAMAHPHRLLEWKEGIAARHQCKPRERGRRRIRVYRSASGEFELALYWTRAMRRMIQ